MYYVKLPDGRVLARRKWRDFYDTGSGQRWVIDIDEFDAYMISKKYEKANECMHKHEHCVFFASKLRAFCEHLLLDSDLSMYYNGRGGS
jgi:hypothetical protein